MPETNCWEVREIELKKKVIDTKQIKDEVVVG